MSIWTLSLTAMGGGSMMTTERLFFIHPCCTLSVLSVMIMRSSCRGTWIKQRIGIIFTIYK
jgi:hypothetical protein